MSPTIKLKSISTSALLLAVLSMPVDVFAGVTVGVDDGHGNTVRTDFTNYQGTPIDPIFGQDNVLIVGNTDIAELRIDGGSEFDSLNSVLGYLSNDSTEGIVTITGAGSRWDIFQMFIVGQQKKGTLNILAGGVLKTRYARFSYESGSTSEINVIGAGSKFLTQYYLTIGELGGLSSQLNINSGGFVRAGSLEFGKQPGSTAIINLEGSSSRMVVDDRIVAGYSADSFYRINVSDYAELTFDSLSYATGTNEDFGIVLDDGVLNVGKLTKQLLRKTSGTGVINTPSHVFDQVINFTEKDLAIRSYVYDSQANAHLTINMDFSQRVSILGAGSVGKSGVLNINSGVKIESFAGLIGQESGSKGIVNIEGVGTVWEAGGVIVGVKGDGVMNIMGGAVVRGYGYISSQAGSKGEVNISGQGSMWDMVSRITLRENGSLNINDGGIVNSTEGVVGSGSFVYVRGDASEFNVEKKIRYLWCYDYCIWRREI